MKRYSFLHTDPSENLVRQLCPGAAGEKDKTMFRLLPALGQGSLSVIPFSGEVEIMFFDIARLEMDLYIDFIPQGENGFYFIRFDDFIRIAERKNIQAGIAENRENGFLPGVCLSGECSVHSIFYPREYVLRSVIIKVRKSSLHLLLPGSETPFIEAWEQLMQDRDQVSLPFGFKYRLLLKQLVDKIGFHPFAELFMLKNASSLVRLLRDQALYYTENGLKGYNSTAGADVINLLRVERYLTDNYKAGFPGVQKLSRLSMMSPTKLKSAFKRSFGYTLFDYYQKYRLGLSKMMLEKAMPVKIVAAEFGYSNPSHFAVAFRKEFGIAPSELEPESEPVGN